MVTIRPLLAGLSYAIALCGIVPLFPWLTPMPRLLLVVAMAAGLWQDLRGAWPLKNWLLNAAIVPAFLFYASQLSRANPVQPVVSGLAVMLAVRLLGAKSGRHYQQIHALSLFCLAASSLFDLSPIFLVYLALLLFMVAVALVLLSFHDQEGPPMTLSRGDLRRVLAAGLLMPLASLPLLAFFFLLLPRTPVPLWNFQATQPSRLSGFTDKVEPGGSSMIAESHQLAFRAELPRQAAQPYWRGTVFNRLDGRRWVRDAAVPAEHLEYGPSRLRQTIYPEPGLSGVLLALDAPAAITAARAKRSPDGVYEAPVARGRRQHYGAESVAVGTLPVSGTIDRDFYLRLPADLPYRLLELAADIQGRADSDAGRVVELLADHFRQGDYRYVTQGLPTGDQALEQFLFETRQGNCEFFASAFAIVARAAGVPTRLVGGYLGGDYNALGAYYLVNEQMAHVWIEAFVEDRGWLRIDPSSFAQNAAAVWGGSQRRSWLVQLRLAIDSFDHAWNRSVITYDFERQVDTARTLGERFQVLTVGRALPTRPGPLLVMAGVLIMGALLICRRRLGSTPEERLLRRFYRRLERDCDLRVQRGEQGLFELAAATGNKKVLAFVEIYAAAVYRDRRLTTLEITQLRKILDGGFPTA